MGWGRTLALAPSQKSRMKYRERIRQATASDQTYKTVEQVAAELNAITRGYWNYFSQGMTQKARHALDGQLWMRMKRWVERKHKPKRRRKGHSGQTEPRNIHELVHAATKRLVYGRDIRAGYRAPAACFM